jgi:hypothetical protein
MLFLIEAHGVPCTVRADLLYIMSITAAVRETSSGWGDWTLTSLSRKNSFIPGLWETCWIKWRRFLQILRHFPSIAFHKCSVLIFICMLLLLERHKHKNITGLSLAELKYTAVQLLSLHSYVVQDYDDMARPALKTPRVTEMIKYCEVKYCILSF